jgi:hypothetical protein
LLLAAVPATRDGKSNWLKQLAGGEEIAIRLVKLLGGDPYGLDVPFRSLFHSGSTATMTRGRNGQITYRDPALVLWKREYQTIPELAVTLQTGIPRRLPPLQLAIWSLRLLHHAELIVLPAARVPTVAADSPAAMRLARDGFELLLRCRWFLDSGAPVAYTRNFVEPWCGIATAESRAAIGALITQDVIRKAGEAASNFKNPTSLYLPGEEKHS